LLRDVYGEDGRGTYSTVTKLLQEMLWGLEGRTERCVASRVHSNFINSFFETSFLIE
jgi:hypothetical protein